MGAAHFQCFSRPNRCETVSGHLRCWDVLNPNNLVLNGFAKKMMKIEVFRYEFHNQCNSVFITGEEILGNVRGMVGLAI